MPLNRKVKYTSSTKPATCNHLNDSQPRPRETTQINRVLQVSMVERDVALTVLVTDRPKKLKPLIYHVSIHAYKYIYVITSIPPYYPLLPPRGGGWEEERKRRVGGDYGLTQY